MSHNPYTPPKARVDDATPVTPEPGAPASSARLFSPTQIAVAAFLGSPIAAAWFAARNFKALAQPLKARRTLQWSVVATLALVGIAVMLPDRTPNSVLPLLYTMVIRVAAEPLFAATVKSHLKSGGMLGSWWRVIGISLLFSLGLVASIFAIAIPLASLGLLDG